jgi:hypothetical protein
MGRGGGETEAPEPAPARAAYDEDAAEDERYDERFACLEHDYDPRWDYILRADQFEHPLALLAQQRLDELAAREDTPFERAHVHPADLTRGPHAGQNPVGVYCSGTYNEPVVLIDIDAHAGYEDQVVKTVEHEIAHAIQEWSGEGAMDWADEDEAELHEFL